MVIFVYDDVIDKSDKCWGKLIILKKWDQIIVILIGNFLLVLGFEYLMVVKDNCVY